MRFLLLFCFLLPAAFGQFERNTDFSGTYKADVLTSSGKAENTLVLKMTGKKLAGTLTNQMGQFPIQNGSVDGDDVFFNIVVKDEGDDFKMTYRGHVFGDEITFKIEAGERIIEMVAKKAKAKDDAEAR